MKFSNGCWLQREDCGCFSPAQVYFTKIEADSVTVCAPTGRINHRGDTLGGVNLTIQISAPYPEVLRMQVWHHAGLRERTPKFELAPARSGLLRAQESEELLTVSSGTLRIEIRKDNASFAFFQGDKKLTGSQYRDLAYMKTDWRGTAYDRGPEDAYMRQQLTLGVGELIYGLGERFGAFVKNGQSVDIWNEDGGTSTEQSYKSIPFYLSNRGYGVFVNHPERVSFEVASEMVSRVGFSVPGERLDYFLIGGPTMKDVLVRYTDITGKPGMPAPWTFGLWLSTSFTTNYDEATVNSFVDGMLERGIPLKVFHFDCFWMKEFSWCDFLWDHRVFPAPVGMLKRLKEKGLKICVWINPYIGQESAIFREGVEGGYFLKRPNGDVWQWDMWQPGMAIVDFTNPAARAWYGSKLEALLDMGVDCFKTDFGERIPTDCVYFDGSDPVKMHNYYTYLYNQTVHDVISAKKGEKEAILFARSATAGGQKFPVHWGDSLLVAPIFNDQSMAEYYLPAGTWTSALTGEARQGGKWYREKHGYLSIPLYARENSILALGAQDDDAVYDYADGVTLNVYALQDGATAQTVVYSPDNQAELHAQVSRQGGVYRIRLQGQKPCKIALINAGIPRSASCPYQLDGATPILCPEGNGEIIVSME